MKKLLLFFACFVAVPPFLHAQPDSLTQEIMIRVSTPVQVSNGRQMFLEELLAGNEQKAGEIRNYLNSLVHNTVYVAFTETEYFLSLYWTGDYDELLINTVMANPPFSRSRDSQIRPTYDELSMKMLPMTFIALEALDDKLDRTVLNTMERDYLKLLLRWLVVQQHDLSAARSISDQARNYLERYPYAPYRPFIINHLIYDFEVSDWGYGLFLGIGPLFFDEQSKRDFNNAGFNMTFGGDVFYRNLYMGLGFLLGGTGLNRDITFKGYDFTSEDHMTVGGLDLRAGYKVFDSPRFALVPYGSIGFSDMSLIRKDDDEYEKNRSSLAYGGGAFLDIKFPFRNSAEYLLTGRVYSYTSLRFRYHITSANFRLPGANKTLMHWLSIEWGGVFRKVHRIQYY